jgi:hypothetical protein
VKVTVAAAAVAFDCGTGAVVEEWKTETQAHFVAQLVSLLDRVPPVPVAAAAAELGVLGALSGAPEIAETAAVTAEAGRSAAAVAVAASVVSETGDVFAAMGVAVDDGGAVDVAKEAGVVVELEQRLSVATVPKKAEEPARVKAAGLAAWPVGDAKLSLARKVEERW